MSETITALGTDGQSFSAQYYGSLAEAHAYFQLRLHEFAWSNSAPADRPKALWAATQVIDSLAFKGEKHSVWLLGKNATPEAKRQANLDQKLEFPRGADTEVPRDIRVACYEIAYSLLDGKDPEQELEALAITSTGYSSVRTTYNRSQVPIEHLINGIPNATAWRLLRPFLRDSDAIKLSRV